MSEQQNRQDVELHAGIGRLGTWAFLAVLWANITSLPLFASRFLGDFFRSAPRFPILRCSAMAAMSSS